jgi:predicted RNA-binding Zn-ribbon protein involved in translation (DUF1610 family)
MSSNAPYDGKRTCPKCGHNMLDGDLAIDEAVGWYEADPKQTLLTSRRYRKDLDRTTRKTVVAFRCENCGAVELWTPQRPLAERSGA